MSIFSFLDDAATLNTERLLLKRFAHTDFSEILELFRYNWKIHYIHSLFPIEPKKVSQELLECLLSKKLVRSVSEVNFVVELSNKKIGFITLYDASGIFYKGVEIAIFIDVHSSKRGYATECLEYLSTFLFQRSIDFVKIQCYQDNSAMQKIMSKLNFTLQGEYELYSQRNICHYRLCSTSKRSCWCIVCKIGLKFLFECLKQFFCDS